MRFLRTHLLLFVLLGLALVITACGGGADSPPSPETYSVSGTVTDDNNNPIAGVVLTFSENTTSTTTDSAGKWTQTGLQGTSTVTPTHDDYTFEPAFRPLTKAATNINFVGTKKPEAGGPGDPGEPGAPLAIELKAASTEIVEREDVKLTANVTGSGAEVTWTVAPEAGSFAPQTGPNVTWTAPNVAGEYTITATATLDGNTVSDHIAIEVKACVGCIFTLAELQNMNDDLNGNYILMNDIDASPTSTGSGNWGPGGFQPIGSQSQPFTGTFDGGGHTIEGLYMHTADSTQHMGLFGYIGPSATIENVHLVAVNVEGISGVGGLVGINDGGSITNVHVDAEVRGREDVGGLVGYNKSGTITGGQTSGTVTGGVSSGGTVRKNTGGLVGVNEGRVENSLSSSTVSGQDNVGGLVGLNATGGDIENSQTDGVVENSSQNVGGLVGENNGHVRNSSSEGSVSGNLKVGGLVGRNDNGIIENHSFSSASVTGDADVGGLVGLNISAEITDSHSTGNVKAEGTRETNIGGLVGHVTTAEYVTNTIEGSYSTSKVEGKENVGGLIGLVFGAAISKSYSSGDVVGTGDNVGGLVGHAKTYTNASFASSIVDSFSTATVNGKDKVGGLVGLNEGAKIERSYTLPNPAQDPSEYDVTSTYGHTGGLVGYNSREIVNSYSWNSVQSSSSEGGVAGGLVGWNVDNGRVKHSYSIGAVSAHTSGGLVAGGNSTVEESFWDTGASEIYISPGGGTGKPTSDMQDANTFNSWDNDVWEFPQGDYPDLKANSRP